MPNKNKLVVNILSKDYTLKSDDSVAHMEKVSKFVKDKINDIKAKNRKLNSAMIAVLTALNIADEYFKVLEYNKELEKRVESPEYELQNLRTKLDKITNEFDKKNRAYNKIIDEFNSLFENSAIYENGLNELRGQVTDLRKDITLKETELKESDRKIDLLKHKIEKKDEEITEAEEELDTFIKEFDEKNSK